MTFKINTKITNALRYNPTQKSYRMTVEEMCSKISKEELVLPLYQRDISWNLQKSIDLFNFQLFGKAPISPISLNTSIANKENTPQVSFLKRIPILIDSSDNSQLESVVDGQQRLTTSYKAYINHPSFEKIVLDLRRGSFKELTDSIIDGYIPVGILLNQNIDVLDKFINTNEMKELYMPIINVRSKLLSYTYTINTAENLSETEQIQWFEVLNNAGSRISALQMAFSKLKLKDLDIYTSYTQPFIEKINQKNLQEHFSPFSTNLSYPIAALNPSYEVIVKNKKHNNNHAPIPSDTKEKNIVNLPVTTICEMIDMTMNNLDKTLDFMDHNKLLTEIDRIDPILYLLGFFIFNTSMLTQKETEDLINWTLKIDFTNKSNGQRRNIYTKLISKSFD